MAKADRTERVELTVLVMLTDQAGQMLLQDRLDPDWGGICFPGGHVERGESFVRAAIREMEEETGLTVEDPILCGVKQFPIDGGRYIVLFFRSSRYTGTPFTAARRDRFSGRSPGSLREDGCPTTSRRCWTFSPVPINLKCFGAKKTASGN